MPLALCARSPRISRFVAAQEGEGVNTCDYPLEFDEKAVWAGLDNYAPAVAQLIQRFFFADEISLAIRNTIVQQRVGIVAAVCKWLQAAENMPVWESWLPPSRFWVQCELGEIVSDGRECIPCPGWARFTAVTPVSACVTRLCNCAAGAFSKDVYSTNCTECPRGRLAAPRVTQSTRDASPDYRFADCRLVPAWRRADKLHKL